MNIRLIEKNSQFIIERLTIFGNWRTLRFITSVNKEGLGFSAGCYHDGEKKARKEFNKMKKKIKVLDVGEK